MVTIKIIQSGSSGNCYRISNSQTTIMLEAGIKFRAIQKAFRYKLSNVSGCLISHSHSDHCKSVEKLSQSGLDIWMSDTTQNELSINNHRIHIFKNKQEFNIGTFKILPFFVHHDVENHGFLIQDMTSKEKICFATDTSCVTFKFCGISYYMIECNNCRKIMKKNIELGLLPESLAYRISRNHFELANVKKFIKQDLVNLKGIYLLHISKLNGNAEFFQKEIQELTGVPVYVD